MMALPKIIHRGASTQPLCTRRQALANLTSLGALPVSPRPIATSAGAARPVQARGLPADQSKRWKGSALGNLSMANC